MIPAATRRLVRERAGNRCEYCQLPQDAVPFATFHVEHIVARQHQGGDEPGNLALSCHHCNAHKGPNLSGIDPDSGQVVRLFDPRRQALGRSFPASGWLDPRHHAGGPCHRGGPRHQFRTPAQDKGGLGAQSVENTQMKKD